MSLIRRSVSVSYMHVKGEIYTVKILVDVLVAHSRNNLFSPVARSTGQTKNLISEKKSTAFKKHYLIKYILFLPSSA